MREIILENQKTEEQKEAEFKQWQDTEVTVTLTNEQWSTLRTFLLLTTNYRKREIAAYRKLLEGIDENKEKEQYKNSESNADFWQEMSNSIEHILEEIDNRNY